MKSPDQYLQSLHARWVGNLVATLAIFGGTIGFALAVALTFG